MLTQQLQDKDHTMKIISEQIVWYYQNDKQLFFAQI